METYAKGITRARRADRPAMRFQDEYGTRYRGYRVMPFREFDDLADSLDRGPRVTEGRGLGRILRDSI